MPIVYYPDYSSTPPSLYCGSFESDQSQTNAGSTSANLITFNNTTTSVGVTLVDGSKITYAHTGKYLFNLLGQFAFTGGASDYSIVIWAVKNGTIVPNSSRSFTTTSAQNSQTLANMEDIYAINAGDYLQFYWRAVATGMALTPVAASSNPTRPAGTSTVFNTWNVG